MSRSSRDTAVNHQSETISMLGQMLDHAESPYLIVITMYPQSISRQAAVGEQIQADRIFVHGQCREGPVMVPSRVEGYRGSRSPCFRDYNVHLEQHCQGFSK